MKDLRVWIKGARTIVLDYEAEEAVDYFSVRYERFDVVYRDIEGQLATRPADIGIRGVIADELEV